MVEQLTSEAFRPESDKRLGIGAYAKEILWSYTGTFIAIATVALGKLTNYKVPIIDGSASIITRAWEKIWHIKALNFSKATVQNFNRMGIGARIEGASPTALVGDILDKGTHAQQQAIRHPWFSSLPLANDFNNFFKALEVGGVLYLFRTWAHKEEKRFDLVEGYDRLSKLPHLKPSDDELREENASLKAQLEFLEQPDAKAKLEATGPRSKIATNGLESIGRVEKAAKQLE